MRVLLIVLVVLSSCSQASQSVPTPDPLLYEVDKVIMRYRDSLMILQNTDERSPELLNDALGFVRDFGTLDFQTGRAAQLHDVFVKDCSIVGSGKLFGCVMLADQIVGFYLEEMKNE